MPTTDAETQTDESSIITIKLEIIIANIKTIIESIYLGGEIGKSADQFRKNIIDFILNKIKKLDIDDQQRALDQLKSAKQNIRGINDRDIQFLEHCFDFKIWLASGNLAAYCVNDEAKLHPLQDLANNLYNAIKNKHWIMLLIYLTHPITYALLNLGFDQIALIQQKDNVPIEKYPEVSLENLKYKNVLVGNQYYPYKKVDLPLLAYIFYDWRSRDLSDVLTFMMQQSHQLLKDCDRLYLHSIQDICKALHRPIGGLNELSTVEMMLIHNCVPDNKVLNRLIALMPQLPLIKFRFIYRNHEHFEHNHSLQDHNICLLEWALLQDFYDIELIKQLVDSMSPLELSQLELDNVFGQSLFYVMLLNLSHSESLFHPNNIFLRYLRRLPSELANPVYIHGNCKITGYSESQSASLDIPVGTTLIEYIFNKSLCLNKNSPFLHLISPSNPIITHINLSLFMKIVNDKYINATSISITDFTKLILLLRLTHSYNFELSGLIAGATANTKLNASDKAVLLLILQLRSIGICDVIDLFVHIVYPDSLQAFSYDIDYCYSKFASDQLFVLERELNSDKYQHRVSFENEPYKHIADILALWSKKLSSPFSDYRPGFLSRGLFGRKPKREDPRAKMHEKLYAYCSTLQVPAIETRHERASAGSSMSTRG